MLEKGEINKIKDIVEEFFSKMTIPVADMKLNISSGQEDSQAKKDENTENKDVVILEIKLEEPQILIGQGGQTLFEIQRILRTILNKRVQKVFYFNIDINEYKKKKIEYLENLAKELADQVSLTKENKILPPMSSYERRIIHAELARRNDVITESSGDGYDRHIIIKAK